MAKKRRGSRSRTGSRRRVDQSVRPHRNRGRSREAVYAEAHRWRLAMAEVAREQGLTLADLVPSPAHRSPRLRLLAEEVTRRVGFEVRTHSIRALLLIEPDLVAAYLDGRPPTPEQRRETAVRKQRSSILRTLHPDRQPEPAPEPTSSFASNPHEILQELNQLVEATESASRQLQRAIARIRPMLTGLAEARALLKEVRLRLCGEPTAEVSATDGRS